MPTVNVHQAKARLSRLLDLAEAARGLSSLGAANPSCASSRVQAQGQAALGPMRGRIVVDDGILDPLAEAGLVLWEGKAGRGCSTAVPHTNEGKP